jgi:hypothetical protein
MAQEPIIEKTFELPLDYVFTLRATPATIRRTAVRLLPWAIVAMLPAGSKKSRMAISAATRLSPWVRQSLK